MLDAERSDSRNMFLTRKQVVSVEESPPALGPCSDSSNGSNSEELEFDRESLPATISRMRVTPLPSRIPSDLSASSEGNSNVKNDLEVAMVVKNDAPSPKGKRKKVRFDTITIRCMRLIAGDHPSCMEGPSVSNIVGLVTSDCLLPFWTMLTIFSCNSPVNCWLEADPGSYASHWLLRATSIDTAFRIRDAIVWAWSSTPTKKHWRKRRTNPRITTRI